VHPPRPFLWIWNSSCSNKVFSWHLLIDRLNVRNIFIRKKHKLEENNYNCVLCPNSRKETTFHFFFSFNQACWSSLNILWDFNSDFYSVMDEARGQFAHNFFMEVKDGNGYPLSVCPRVKNPLGTDSGTSLYPRVRVRVAFDIHRYLQNG
jgi:hypothetical protein